MTDAEFEELTREIHETMFRLESMQREYRRQTGRRYVPSGPIRPKRTTTTTKEVLNGERVHWDRPCAA